MNGICKTRLHHDKTLLCIRHIYGARLHTNDHKTTCFAEKSRYSRSRYSRNFFSNLPPKLRIFWRMTQYMGKSLTVFYASLTPWSFAKDRESLIKWAKELFYADPRHKDPRAETALTHETVRCVRRYAATWRILLPRAGNMPRHAPKSSVNPFPIPRSSYFQYL